MYPSFYILGHEIALYTVFTILGIIAATIYVARVSTGNTAISSVQVVHIPVVAGLGAFLGAHILFGITNLKAIWWIVCNFNQIFADVSTALSYFYAVFGGMVFYGGLIGGLIAGYIYAKHMNLDTEVYADIYAPAIPLFHVFGRIGCFFAGCCYGVEWSWGFIYTIAPVEASNGVVRLPIQLIESGINVLIFIFLAYLARKKICNGMRLELYLLVYGIVRFCTEFFRGDTYRGAFLMFSTSQWISILLCIYALIRFYTKLIRPLSNRSG